MKNLQNYGVQELSAKEIRETDGGIFGLLIQFAASHLLRKSTEREIADFWRGYNKYYSL